MVVGLRVGILVIAGALVLSCRSAPVCPAAVRTDPDAALTELDTVNRGWKSLKAEARVTQWADRGRIRGTVLMFLERPTRVRFDVLTQFGPAAVLTSDGEHFQLSDLRENTFLEGPTCPQNIARLLGIEVSSENVVRFLTGDTPVIDAVEKSMECRDGGHVVRLVGADGTVQELAVAVDDTDQRLRLRRSSLQDADGSLIWEATYEDYQTFEGHRFPTKVRFVDHRRDADTEVRVKALSLDPRIPPDAFEQTPRPGMRLERATCP